MRWDCWVRKAETWRLVTEGVQVRIRGTRYGIAWGAGYQRVLHEEGGGFVVVRAGLLSRSHAWNTEAHTHHKTLDTNITLVSHPALWLLHGHNSVIVVLASSIKLEHRSNDTLTSACAQSCARGAHRIWTSSDHEYAHRCPLRHFSATHKYSIPIFHPTQHPIQPSLPPTSHQPCLPYTPSYLPHA